MSASSRKQRPRVDPLDFGACQILIRDLQALESRAHRLMMVSTAQAINAAKNAAGWELAERVERAQSASENAKRT